MRSRTSRWRREGLFQLVVLSLVIFGVVLVFSQITSKSGKSYLPGRGLGVIVEIPPPPRVPYPSFERIRIERPRERERFFEISQGYNTPVLNLGNLYSWASQNQWSVDVKVSISLRYDEQTQRVHVVGTPTLMAGQLGAGNRISGLIVQTMREWVFTPYRMGELRVHINLNVRGDDELPMITVDTAGLVPVFSDSLFRIGTTFLVDQGNVWSERGSMAFGPVGP